MIGETSLPLTLGIDEVGRGALAGPVVAAACALPPGPWPVRIGDSKQMSPEEREVSFAWLTQYCVHGIGRVEAVDIDLIGIMAATELAMQHAVKAVSISHPDLYLLVDGRDKFWFDHPHSSLVQGDTIEPCIGAASILAKVTRDRWMTELARRIAGYGFEQHKGYGSAEHMAAIRRLGPSAEHRKSFLRHQETLCN